MNINLTLKNNLCASCGMCVSNCTRNAIYMEYSKKEGIYLPQIDKEKCTNCGLCYLRCPMNKNEKQNTVLGKYTMLCLAHSLDYNVRNDSTSGGVINTLVRFLIEKEYVDCVLMTSYNKGNIIETDSIEITKENLYEICENPRNYASRYVVNPILSHYKECKNKYKKLALVGTPCQIRALGLSKEENVFKIGITCSAGQRYIATEEVKRKKGFTNSAIFYRGDGWPGNNSLIQDKTKKSEKHTGSLFECMFSSQIFKNSACDKCYDHFAEESDISFCDFWSQDEMKNEKVGNSCVIARTDKASDIIKQMREEGYIDIVKELIAKEVIETQKSVLIAKKTEIRNSSKYKIYKKIIKLIFNTKIYRLFNKRVYRKLGSIYRKIINSNINEIEVMYKDL